MIIKLANSKLSTSIKLQKLFLKSYSIEAKLLEAKYFPPLERRLESFQKSTNTFLGLVKNEVIVGAIEIDPSGNSIHIQSLVVHPDYFRQGIAESLVKYVLNSFDSMIFTVETGLKNIPAIQLYFKMGFKEIKQYRTKEGIMKIRFERKYEA